MASSRFHESEVSVAELASLCEVETNRADYPLAAEVARNVLLYDVPDLGLDVAEHRAAAEDEFVRALADGPGVIVLRGAFADTSVIDAATDAFNAIIAAEVAAGGERGDHFGKPGANSRIWNAQNKLATYDPELFVEYFANDAIAVGSHAWLGPGYQITSQVNLVNPGGKPQDPHRDYHLGFQSNAIAEDYPAHVHLMSPVLTLQGAVAHCDMSVESGPTMLLPHSQKYTHGYLAWRVPAVRDYFDEHMVQLPLSKGDVVWFSPALLHGAGENRTSDVARMANLLQVSSAFGRAMETVDRDLICRQIYPVLLARRGRAGWTAAMAANAIAAGAEGYSFPTNLDLDQPVGGLAPQTQAELLAESLAAGRSTAEFEAALAAHTGRTLA